MIYPIVIFGSPILRAECERIESDYPELEKLIEDMFLTLEAAEGVGLAAPQIGKNIRLFIVDCTPWGEDNPELAEYRRAFINPDLLPFGADQTLQRGVSLAARNPRGRAPFAVDPDALHG